MKILADIFCCTKKPLPYTEQFYQLQNSKNNKFDSPENKTNEDYVRPFRNIELPPVPNDDQFFIDSHASNKKSETNYYATVPISSIYYGSLKKGSSRSSIQKNPSIYKGKVSKHSDVNEILSYYSFNQKNGIIDSTTLSSDSNAYTWINNKKNIVESGNPLKMIRRLMKKAIRHHIKAVDSIHSGVKDEIQGSGQYRQVAVRESIPSLKARNAYPVVLYSEPLLGIPAEINENSPSINTNETNQNYATMNGYQNTNEYDRVYCYPQLPNQISSDVNTESLYNGISIENNESGNAIHSFNRRPNAVAAYAVSPPIISNTSTRIIDPCDTVRKSAVNDSDAYTEIPEESNTNKTRKALSISMSPAKVADKQSSHQMPIYAISKNHQSFKNKTTVDLSHLNEVSSTTTNLDNSHRSDADKTISHYETSNSLAILMRKLQKFANRLIVRKTSHNVSSLSSNSCRSPSLLLPSISQQQQIQSTANTNQHESHLLLNASNKNNMNNNDNKIDYLYQFNSQVNDESCSFLPFEEMDNFRHMDSEVELSQGDGSEKSGENRLQDEDEYAVTSHIDSNPEGSYVRLPIDEYDGIVFPHDQQQHPAPPPPQISEVTPTPIDPVHHHYHHQQQQHQILPHSSTYDDLIYSQA